MHVFLTAPTSGPHPVLAAKGPDGCYSLPAQKASHLPADGPYDVLVLSRSNLNGICAVRPNLPVCRNRVLPDDDVTTKISGLWPTRSSCHGNGGLHWPQFCAAGGGGLNGTAFGMLASANPSVDACLDKMKWPRPFCEKLEEMQTAWPSAQGRESEAWSQAWARHGTCSGLHPEAYFDAALAAHAAVLEHDKQDEKTLGPKWPSVAKSGGPFASSFTLVLLAGRFGGAYASGFHCEAAKDGRLFLTSIKQCVRTDGAGGYVAAACPRWIVDEDTSCKPKGTVGGARVWLGVAGKPSAPGGRKAAAGRGGRRAVLHSP